MNTEVFKNPAWLAMRALVLSAFDRIVWRHHGIGALQGYIVENVEPEVRVHVWSKRLLKPGMDQSGDVHDHRFSMVSHVLAGTIDHEEFREYEHPEGRYEMMALTHARAAADTNYHGPTTVLVGRFHVMRNRISISAGQSYTFPAQQFHRSPVDRGEVAVTCVEKHGQVDVPARLLYPVDREPVMAFGHEMDQGLINSVLAEAKSKLSDKT